MMLVLSMTTVCTNNYSERASGQVSIQYAKGLQSIGFCHHMEGVDAVDLAETGCSIESGLS